MYTASWRDVVRRDLFGPRPDPRDRPYRFVIRLALVVFRLFRFRFDVRGAEQVPTTGGAVVCSNHVSYLDFTFLGLAALPQHRLVDRKSTRLNSSHANISYAVFCLKK